ncbi:MAG: NHLP family bacteriocin export ABC transporter peptidase/permease/ATPase subunit [Actinomycetota bacterium]
MVQRLEELEEVVAGRSRAVAQRLRHPRDHVATNSDVSTHTVRTPTVLQMEAVECGAASLAMVLGYYGKWLPLTELRRACGVSRNGSKAPHIAKAARSYGLEVHPLRASAEELATVDVPAILWWNFNHFVVFEGFHNGDAILNDPAVGRVHVGPEDFARSYTGIVLTFATTPDFEPGGHRPRLMEGVIARTHRVRSGLVVAVIAGLLAAVPGLLTPALTGAFVDDVLVDGTRSTAWYLAAGIAMAAAFRVIATVIEQRQLLRVQNALAVTGASRLLWHILRLPLSFLGVRSVSDVALRMDATTTVAQLVSGQLATIGLSVMTATLYGVVMLIYSWQLSLAVFALSAVNFIVLRAILRRRATANRALYQDQAKVWSTTYGGLRMIETLKATSGEADYFSRWAGQQAALVNVQNRLATPTVILGAVPTMIASLSMAAVIALGGWQVIEGDLSIGGLIAFQSLAIGFATPITRLVNTAGTLQDVATQLQRIDDALDEPVDPATIDDAAGDDGRRLTGDIEMDDVSFGYATLDPPLIDALSLRLAPGTRVALVGPSGAGKSTIVALLGGLLTPWSGTIRYDGVDRSALPRAEFARSFALVEQRGVLFEGTIRENLTLWNESIPERAVIAAARDAQIHDEIMSRPDGYDAVVDEAGRNWSGGERQRLEIARALAREPTILVLDEATSALDPTTERDLDLAIRRRGITTFIVAHRLSTIRDADEIIVLDHGKIAEQGSHDALLATGGLYSSLVGAGGDVGE